MSLIAFTGRYLIADRKCIVQKGQYANVQYYRKIRKSKCNRFAYGAVGTIIPDCEAENIERKILERLTSLRQGDQPSEENNKFFEVLCGGDDRNMVIVAKGIGLLLNNAQNIWLTDLEAFGTGGLVFMTAFKQLGDIYKAYYATEDLIGTVGMPNWEQPDVIDVDELETFLVVEQGVVRSLAQEQSMAKKDKSTRKKV